MSLTTQTSDQAEIKPKILVVEDSGDLCLLWERLFRRKGYDLICANSGKDAIEIAKDINQKFDLILSDYFLPDMKGTSILDQIREFRPNIPCIFVTGARDQAVLENIQARPLTTQLNKPVKFVELLETVERFSKVAPTFQLQ